MAIGRVNRRYPQTSIAGLLVLTLFAALFALCVRWLGYGALLVVYLFAPATLGALCGVIQWPNSQTPLLIVGRALVLIACVSLILPVGVAVVDGVFGGVAVFIIQATATAWLWLPQYLIFAGQYD